MRYAIIFHGEIQNIIILEPANLADLNLIADDIISTEGKPEVGIGWKYNNGEFISPYPVDTTS